MTFALWSILLVACLPIIWVGLAKSGEKNYDNNQPRIWLSKLTGWQQRANWAQVNAYEVFPPYAAAVLTAQLVGANQTLVDVLAGVFLVCRVLHGVFYIKDMAGARSLVWTLGFFTIIGLFMAAAWTAA